MEPRQAEKLSNPGEVALNPESGQIQAGVSKSDDFEERIQKIKEEMADRGINLTAEDMKAVLAYLKTEHQWVEVYRRLAKS